MPAGLLLTRPLPVRVTVTATGDRRRRHRRRHLRHRRCRCRRRHRPHHRDYRRCRRPREQRNRRDSQRKDAVPRRLRAEKKTSPIRHAATCLRKQVRNWTGSLPWLPERLPWATPLDGYQAGPALRPHRRRARNYSALVPTKARLLVTRRERRQAPHRSRPCHRASPAGGFPSRRSAGRRRMSAGSPPLGLPGLGTGVRGEWALIGLAAVTR